jgi:hypothetical protein
MTKRPAIDAGLGRQVAIYDSFVALHLAPGKPFRYEDSIASPWSADLVPSRGSFELLSVDDKAGTVSVRWRQAIDPAKGVEVAWRMVESITGLKRGGTGAPKELPRGLELEDEATVVIARASGIPQRIEHRRHVALGGASTTSRWTLERLPDRAPR